MSHIPLVTANKNCIKIRQYNPAMFDYTRITLATNKGPSNIMEDYQYYTYGSGTTDWCPRVRVDKLASNEALMVYRGVKYSDLGAVLESIGYLSQKNHSTEDIFLRYNNIDSFARDDVIDRVSSLQDLPLHSLESVMIHIPYGLRIGLFRQDDPVNPDQQYRLSGTETITRAAGVGIPPIIEFGDLNDVTIPSTVSLDLPGSLHINRQSDWRSFLNLPAMVRGESRDPTRHGGTLLFEGRACLHWTHVVVLRFSENVR